MTKQLRQINPKTNSERTCVLVLGMHRSGTSALTRVLNLLGATLPREVMGTGEGNEAGHWESARLVAYHDRFLGELGSSWHDWRPLDLTRMPVARRDKVKADIKQIVEAEYSDVPLFVVKDPRICRFAAFFIEAMESAGIRVVPVITFRNPLEVSASLQKRAIFWPSDYTDADSALLWLTHVLDAEKATRNHGRAIVTYDGLLTDWRKTASGIAAQTGFQFPVTLDEAAPLVSEFLTGGMRHHAYKAGDVALDPVLRGWVSETFEAMIRLAANPAAAQPAAVLDRVHGELLRSAPIIGNLVSAATGARAAAVAAAQEAQARVAATEAGLAERAAELEQARAEIARLAAMEQELARALAKEQNLNAQLAALEARAKAAELSSHELEGAVRNAAADAARLGAESEALRADGEQMRLRVEALDKGFADQDDALAQARAALGAQEGDNRTLDQLVEALKDALGAKDRAWRQSEDARSAAERQVEALNAALQIAEAKVQAQDAVLAPWRQRLEEMSGEVASQAAEMEARTRLVGEQKQRVAALEAWVQSQEEALREAREQTDAACSALDAAEARRDALEAELNDLARSTQAELEQLRREREDLRAQAQARADEGKDIKRQYATRLGLKTKTIAKLEKTLADVEERFAKQHGALSEEQNALLKHLAEKDNRVEALEAAVVNRVAELETTRHALEEKAHALGDGQARIENLEGELAVRTADVARVQTELDQTHTAYRSSTSWKLTAPIRALKTIPRSILYGFSVIPAAIRFGGGILPTARKAVRVWRREGVAGVKWRMNLAAAEHSHPDRVSGKTDAHSYEVDPAIRAQEPSGKREAGSLLDNTDCVPLLSAAPVVVKPARVIAFYLPQFHPIPENDEWWGSGFTEWTNVRPAQPQFIGHQQPRVPGELGYYDLRDTSVQHRQIELAKLYGIEGFCFYFYWFGGKRLLEKPLENWLSDKNLDLPFCVCWANENWSRRWDGLDQEILIAQDHSPADDLAFIQEVSPYLRDPRYIRVAGKPLLLVYRPSLLPSAAETAKRWRRWCRENGIGEIFLAYTQSFERTDPGEYGFDAAVEFPPNNTNPPDITTSVTPLHTDFNTRVYDWSVFPRRSENYPPREYALLRSVCPGWDNTARRKHGGAAFINNTPALYRDWLKNAIVDTMENIADPSERLVFVNAWNEWAEGAYLEPDEWNGYAYLQATREALESAVEVRKERRIVVVSHDAHPHGAQLLSMNMARGFSELGFQVDLIVLGDGPLLPRFAEIATVHSMNLTGEGEAQILRRLEALRASGAEMAIVNSAVSGLIIPQLEKAGIRTVSLIHELPGILESNDLGRHCAAVAKHADKIVFPAQIVKNGFEGFVGAPLKQAVIRPQGSYLRIPFQEEEREVIRLRVRQKLGLRENACIVLSVGYGDHRKGIDLFVEACLGALRQNPHLVALWVGHLDTSLHERQMKRIRAAGLEDRFVFPGLVEEPQEFYFAADVYVLASREDPFPSVVMEALDAKVPVVAFKGVTGSEELLKRGCGVLVPAFDTAIMADEVAALLANPGRAAGLGGVGRSIIDREFRFQHYLRDLLDFAGAPLPRVSVVVPNYNYARFLPERIDSILDQTYPLAELIILDDASTDDSLAVIDELRARIDVPLKVIANETNSGSVFRQWLKGLEVATSDYVWIAEADDLCEPEFLAEAMRGFKHDHVVLSYCQSKQMAQDGTILCNDYLDYVSDVSPTQWTSSYVRGGEDEIVHGLSVKNTIPNVSAVVFRRADILATMQANLNEIMQFRVAGDLCTYVHLLRCGSCAFSAKSLNKHRRHDESVTISRFGLSELEEIRGMQATVRALIPESTAYKSTADAYIEKLRKQFSL